MKHKSTTTVVARIAFGAALMAAMAVNADTATSNRAIVQLRPDETSFWRTATNSVISVPVDMPAMATSGTLTVRGVKYEREYAISGSGDFTLSLPPATSSGTENVYDLTLSFNDGTVQTAKLGLVQGYAQGPNASTRVLSPNGSTSWNHAKTRAVMPIPYGMTSFAVNGVETDTGLGGAQGWYALGGFKSGDEVALSLLADAVTYSADLLFTGFFQINFR